MKTKELSLKIRIPAKFKYLARQPWGDITLFEDEPQIAKGDEGESYWGVQKGEASLFVEDDDILKANESEDWRTSLISI